MKLFLYKWNYQEHVVLPAGSNTLPSVHSRGTEDKDAEDKDAEDKVVTPYCLF